MALIGLINQPFSGKHGDTLVSILDSGRYSRLKLAVAFVRNSGVLELGDAFERFRSAGGAIEVYVGVDRDPGQNLGPSLVQGGVRCTPGRSARGYSGSSTAAA